MNNKTILWGGIALLALAGFIWWGWNSQDAPALNQNNIKASILTASESVYNFGDISMAAGKVSHIFEIMNSTDQDIMLKNMTTSCMCTEAFVLNGGSRMGPYGMAGMGYRSVIDENIAPSKNKQIEVVFDPAAHGPAGVGKMDRTVSVTDANGHSLQFRITANVTP